MKCVLGIDPGTTETAYCLCTVDDKQSSTSLKVQQFAKIENEDMAEVLENLIVNSMVDKSIPPMSVAIEHLESYGMAVGKTTFETAYFIGRLTEICNRYEQAVSRVYRHEEKNLICHSVKANDATIKQALVDLFAEHPEINHGKGSKAKQDYFYGFKADCWSAFAICYTYCKRLEEILLKDVDSAEHIKTVNLDDLPF